MRTYRFNISAFLLLLVVAISSCTDAPVDTDPVPVEMQADNNWIEAEIENGNELWYRVTCDAGSTTAYVEWAENTGHGEDRDYTGDVVISAYQLDGVTPYIEDKDNGYGEKAKSFPLANNEAQFLIKVLPTTPGTFAIRSTTSSVVSVDYIDLEISDTWTDSSIAQNEIIGYKVKYSGEKKLAIIWAEIETPEAGYTADLIVSVLHSDGETFYKDVDKNKDLLDKNKSHSDDPKYILTDPSEKNFKIHVKNTTPGTFALKVYEVTE